MTTRRPIALISDILPVRPGNPMRDRLATRLRARLREAAAPSWRIIEEYAQLDGPEGALLRAEGADALILIGGEDLHPSCYGRPRGYPGEERHWYRADLAQIALVRSAVERGVPVLGIGRGLQVINVASGGTLDAHIDVSVHAREELFDDHRFARHEVAIDGCSRLAHILGTDGLEVSSAHHQSVVSLGDGLCVAARSLDASIEAIEGEGLLGVQ